MDWLRKLWRNWRVPREEPSLGELGERAAERFLRRRGFKIVARGSQERFGELDLVAVERRTVVFVEVKTRRGDRGGHPAEAVDEPKQRRLVLSALAFLRRHDLLENPARFDIVAVTWPRDAKRPRIEHFRHAFEPPDSGGLFG